MSFERGGCRYHVERETLRYGGRTVFERRSVTRECPAPKPSRPAPARPHRIDPPPRPQVEEYNRQAEMLRLKRARIQALQKRIGELRSQLERLQMERSRVLGVERVKWDAKIEQKEKELRILEAERQRLQREIGELERELHRQVELHRIASRAEYNYIHSNFGDFLRKLAQDLENYYLLLSLAQKGSPSGKAVPVDPKRVYNTKPSLALLYEELLAQRLEERERRFRLQLRHWHRQQKREIRKLEKILRSRKFHLPSLPSLPLGESKVDLSNFPLEWDFDLVFGPLEVGLKQETSLYHNQVDLNLYLGLGSNRVGMRIASSLGFSPGPEFFVQTELGQIHRYSQQKQKGVRFYFTREELQEMKRFGSLQKASEARKRAFQKALSLHHQIAQKEKDLAAKGEKAKGVRKEIVTLRKSKRQQLERIQRVYQQRENDLRDQLYQMEEELKELN